MKFPLPALAFSGVTLFAASVDNPVLADHWPTWRGPAALGITAETDLPMRWSATENIRWKTPLPEPGNSTPVVWGNRIFVTQAVGKDNRRTVMCFNRGDGKVLWQSGVTYTEKESSHEANPYCSASPVTDGERVVAWFGSAGVFAYDLQGRELWRRDLGQQDHEWGYGGSPLIHGELVFVQFGPGSRNFIAALNRKNGDLVWQVDVSVTDPPDRIDGFAGQKGKPMGAFSAPIVITTNQREELIASFPGRLLALDPKTGRELWFCRGLNPLVYTSPIYGEGVVVSMGGFGGVSIAVKPGGAGDVTDSRLWEKRKTKQRLGSGVIHEGHVYVLNSDGVAECLDLKTGDTVWAERVKGPGPRSESWSSIVLSGNRLYVPNRSGDVVILRASPKFELMGANSVGNELSNSSLAISNGELFFRTYQNLWCISKRARQTAQN